MLDQRRRRWADVAQMFFVCWDTVKKLYVSYIGVIPEFYYILVTYM